ncbi:MAG: CamS family sex pheromone protein [Alkalibacterium sp.]|nr:CamS family sex pheromone protein [Alkalibacterium sp.]TVP92044.1 MAG: CamS family sex pheromone protein [Alkalibacterium sp.]
MKKEKLIGLLIANALVLSACGMFPDPVDPNQPEVEELEQVEQSGQDNDVEDEASTVEAQFDSGYYRPVINEDGTYSVSQSRGLTRGLNSNISLETFEEDLMRHSQRFFPTEDHFFQEGQFIPADTINSWLSRQEPEEEEPEESEEETEETEETSEETEETVDLGLNPEENEFDSIQDRNPMYLSSVLEHNFYVQSEDGLELSGISIGLALNSVDYFDGGNSEQVIDRDTLLEEGQRMADEIMPQLREIEGLEDVPIVIGLYEHSRRDSLAPGTFIALSVSENGSTSVNNWQAINEQRIVFPLEGMQSAEGNSFANFRSEIENFFPNVSGITGIAHYVEEQLMHLEISIMTQFYGKGEIIAFTQYINETATSFLPDTVPVEIKLESLNGMESFLYREAEQENYEVYIFN